MDDETECPASAEGIAQCLRMLTEEAAVLNLSRTLAALKNALATCVSEGVRNGTETMPFHGDAVLH